ncbi:MAG TPA: 3-methyl-2-oxobutanoate hydroxymethyltransferase [Chthoniobacteraceae bacterium]|nr:3-methyl-2-oxobutanoate hydroxymethyltransferase [Chthoniobacteraceae bacterium]
MSETSRVTVEKIRRMKSAGEKIAVLTAYDYPLARMLDECGVDILLVGDSLGMVVLGYPDTTHVTMEDMLVHCAAVARGAKHGLIVCDLPYGCYTNENTAVENARRLITAGAHAVKLEGGTGQERAIAAITGAGIPLMAHIGMLPQSVKIEGGYKIKGRTEQEAEALLADAKAVERAGAFAVVMELVEPGLAQKITSSISIPTIGIGSGKGCDGQVLVVHDLIGLFPWFKPKFVTRKAHVSKDISAAVAAYIQEVRSGA